MMDKNVNLYDLLRLLTDERIDAADNVIITKVTYNRSYNRYTFYTATALNRHTHMCTIEPAELNNVTLTAKLSTLDSVKISCDCEDFKYRLEAANNSAGISDIIYSNGQAPVKTNPSNIFGACKHITKAIIFILQRNL